MFLALMMVVPQIDSRAKRRSEFGVEDEFHLEMLSCACVIFSRMWEIRAQVEVRRREDQEAQHEG